VNIRDKITMEKVKPRKTVRIVTEIKEKKKKTAGKGFFFINKNIPSANEINGYHNNNQTV
jgi:hypothetical protein